MAYNAMAHVSNVLMKKEELIDEQLTRPSEEPILKILKAIKPDKTVGQDLKNYFKIMIRPSIGWGPVAEGGDYVAGQPMRAIEGYLQPVLINNTLEVSLHVQQEMEHQDRAKRGETVAGIVDAFIENIRKRKPRRFTGRGDFVLARAIDAESSGTSLFASSSDVPIRAVIGDYVTAYKDASGTGDERGLATSDTGTGYLGSTPLYVDDVDLDANTLTLGAATTTASAKWTDAAVLVPYGVSSTNKTGPYGLEALVDSVKDANFKYDEEDTATYDHQDTIYSLARTDYTQLNCATYNDTGTFSLETIQRMVGKSMGKGGRIANMVIIGHPRQFELMANTHQGNVELGAFRTLTMPGGNLDVFVVTGLGVGTLPFIADYGIPKDTVILLDRSKLRGIELPGGWDKDGSGIFKSKNASSGQGHSAAKVAYWNEWYNWGLVFPDTSVVAYGLATS